MANLTATSIYNSVKWKEDVASRKKAFDSVNKYKKLMEGVKSQVKGIGDIQIKVSGYQQASAKLNAIKNKLEKGSGAGTARTPKSTESLMGPRKPPMQGAYKAELAAAKQLADIEKFEMSPTMQQLSAIKREQLVSTLKTLAAEKGMARALVEQKALARQQLSIEKQLSKEANKQSFAHERSTSSLRQMAGAAFSVYTAFAAIGAVAKTGMEFQKMEASMESVSSSTKEAKENLAFVQKETLRLGGNVVQNTKAFTKLLASKGEMNLDQVKSIYTGVTELAAARGLSADEISGTINALNQMAGKTKVQAEELRQQLAERLPGSVEMFAQAAKDAGLTVKGTVSELEDLMRDGKALAKDILPAAAKIMQVAANKNDALTKSLKNYDKVVSRAGTNLDLFNKALFNEGVEDGLKFLLNGFSDLMESSQVLAKVLGGAFKGAILTLVTPLRLIYAGWYDIVSLINKQWLPSSKATIDNIAAITGSVMGMVIALWAAKKAWAALNMAKGVGKAIGNTVSGKGGKGGGIVDSITGVQKVFVTNMPVSGLGGGAGGNVGKAGKFGAAGLLGMTGMVAGAAAVSYGVSELLDAFGKQFKGYREADAVFTHAMTSGWKSERDNTIPSSYLMGTLGGQQYGTQQPQKVIHEVSVTLDEPLLHAKIADGADARLGKHYSQMF